MKKRRNFPRHTPHTSLDGFRRFSQKADEKLKNLDENHQIYWNLSGCVREPDANGRFSTESSALGRKISKSIENQPVSSEPKKQAGKSTNPENIKKIGDVFWGGPFSTYSASARLKNLSITYFARRFEKSSHFRDRSIDTDTAGPPGKAGRKTTVPV